MSRKKQPTSTIDKYMWSLVEANPNLGVPWYLMASYAYYELDDPFLSDASFDKLAKLLLRRWHRVTHRHKHLITVGDLTAGTLMTREFPEIVKGATLDLLKNHRT